LDFLDFFADDKFKYFAEAIISLKTLALCSTPEHDPIYDTAAIATNDEKYVNSERDFYYTTNDDLQLYCRVYEPGIAQGPVVLCLPGLTRNSRDFGSLATHLAQRYKVLTPDLRGRGRSARDPQWRNYQPMTYVDDIWTLLAALGETRVAIIGTSLGALMAMVMAATRPAAIAGLVLNDAGPEVDPIGLARIAQYVGKQTPVRNWADAIVQTRATYGAALPGLSDAEWEAHTRNAYREDATGQPVPDMDPMIGEAMRASGAPADLWPVFAALQHMPTLVIRGALSDILSAATVARMAREKPDLHQLTVTNRGHAPLLDETECRTAIDIFLANLNP
jgi:pimeloyl-ACP methyl ester carboxylesterase